MLIYSMLYNLDFRYKKYLCYITVVYIILHSIKKVGLAKLTNVTRCIHSCVFTDVITRFGLDGISY